MAQVGDAVTEQRRDTHARLLTVGEVAAILNVSRSTLYSWVEVGAVPYRRLGLGRGVIRFTPSDLEETLETARRRGGVRS